MELAGSLARPFPFLAHPLTAILVPNMKRLLASFGIALLFLPLAFGKSGYLDNKQRKENKLWRADDPRTANPINLYHGRNPLNPANKYRGDNDFNPANKFKFDNPLNPANRFKFGNKLNPANRFHRDSPLNPINRFRSPDDPPKDDWELDYGLDDYDNLCLMIRGSYHHEKRA